MLYLKGVPRLCLAIEFNSTQLFGIEYSSLLVKDMEWAEVVGEVTRIGLPLAESYRGDKDEFEVIPKTEGKDFLHVLWIAETKLDEIEIGGKQKLNWRITITPENPWMNHQRMLVGWDGRDRGHCATNVDFSESLEPLFSVVQSQCLSEISDNQWLCSAHVTWLCIRLIAKF